MCITSMHGHSGSAGAVAGASKRQMQASPPVLSRLCSLRSLQAGMHHCVAAVAVVPAHTMLVPTNWMTASGRGRGRGQLLQCPSRVTRGRCCVTVAAFLTRAVHTTAMAVHLLDPEDASLPPTARAILLKGCTMWLSNTEVEYLLNNHRECRFPVSSTPADQPLGQPPKATRQPPCA